MHLKSCMNFLKIKLQKINKKFSKSFQENKYFYIFFGISFSYFLVWFFVFFPAIMSADSSNQWEQVLQFDFENSHPFQHTLIMYLLSKLWNSPAVVALFQLTISSFLIAHFLNFFSKQKIKTECLWYAFLFFLIFPAFSVYNITIWKDVLFTQLIVLLCIFFVKHFIGGKDKTLVNFWEIVFFSATLVLVSVVRHNGIIYIIFIPLLYVALRMIKLKSFIYLSGLLLMFYFFVAIYLFNALNVKTYRVEFTEAKLKWQFIANSLNHGAWLSEEEKEVILKSVTIEELKNNYDCGIPDKIRKKDIFSTPKYNSSNNIIGYEISQTNQVNIDEFNKMANQVILRNLNYVADDRICLLIKSMGFEGYEKKYLVYMDRIEPNFLNIKEGDNWLKPHIQSYLKYTKDSSLRFIFWFPALYVFFYIYYFVNAIIKKNKIVIGYTLIILVNLPVLFLLSASMDFRYYFMFLFALPFLPLVVILSKQR